MLIRGFIFGLSLMSLEARALALTDCVVLVRRVWEKGQSKNTHQKTTAVHSPRIDFKAYTVDGVGPATRDSLERDVNSLRQELYLKEYQLSQVSIVNPYDTGSSAQKLETLNNLNVEIASIKFKLKNPEALLSALREDTSTQYTDAPQVVTHFSRSGDLTLSNLDMTFHRDPLKPVYLGAKSGSGFYTMPGDVRNSASEAKRYRVNLMAGLSVVDSTQASFQRIYSLVLAQDARKIDILFNEYQKVRLEAGLGSGGLSRESYEQMYGYDVAADLLGAAVIRASNYNSAGGGELIVRTKSAFQSMELADN